MRVDEREGEREREREMLYKRQQILLALALGKPQLVECIPNR